MNKYGLIGRKLGHSFSVNFFSEKFKNENIESVYLNYELSNIDEMKSVLLEKNLKGLNVTIPYKEAIIPFLDELTEEATAIGAVNTVLFRDGKTIGANTDAFGFHQMIKPFLLNTHHKALLFGNGGAAKAVKYVLEQIGLEVLVAARSPREGEFRLEDVNELMIRHCGVLVNCTPVGMFPKEDLVLNIPFEAIHSDHLVIDLIYNPKETTFLRRAKANGAVVLNGETMLREQALQAWKLWNE